MTATPVNTVSPAPAHDTSCSTADEKKSTNPPEATLVTSGPSTSEMSTSLPCSTPQGSAPQTQTESTPTHTEPAPTANSPHHEESDFKASNRPTSTPQVSSSEAPEPPSYGVPSTSSPDVTARPSPPGNTPDGQRPPFSVTSSCPELPDNGSARQPPTGTNCSTHAVPDSSMNPPKSKMSTRPSSTFPKGHTPVPVQVPGSDSHSLSPPFFTIGGLALLAAMMV